MKTEQFVSLAEHADALAALADGSVIGPMSHSPSLTADSEREVAEIDKWEKVACVRHRLRRKLEVEKEQGKLFFTPELVAHCQHPLVAQLDLQWRDRLLVDHFHTFASFTEFLEHKTVIPAGIDIAHGTTGLRFPAGFVAQAFTLVADEGDHAQYTFDLKNQIVLATGIRPLANLTPAYVSAFADIQQSLPAEYRTLSLLLYACVSELNITGTLTKVPKDERVAMPVRETMADHARDECRHHAQFADVFKVAWAQLNSAEQEMLGSLLPRFTRLFLEPDYEAIRASLSSLPLTPAEIEQVIAESYPTASVTASARNSCKASLRLFEQCGVLKINRVREAFHAEGLLG
jgi:hypothetical protein